MQKIIEDKEKFSLHGIDFFNNILRGYVEQEISFSKESGSYCVGLVDIVNSTKITSYLSHEKISKYYSIFLNTMSGIVKQYNGSVVKNIGDCLLFYFPNTINQDKKNFSNALECGITMILCSKIINEKMLGLRLPSLNYRVSMDYGSVVLAKSALSICEDIFGSTVNLCAKINHSAKQNEMVIGNDLYQIVKSIEGYHFELVTGFKTGLKCQYPVYSIIHRF